MDMPSYMGLIEPWKIKLIKQRARRYGFRKDEWPDLMQEIVLTLLAFQYDADHRNGADERTAITAVIDNQLCKRIRTKCCYHRHLQQAALLQKHANATDACLKRLDIQDAIEALPPRDQQVCQGIASGMSKNQLAKKIGCSWHTIDASFTRIRRHFQSLGLDEWMGQ